MRAGAHIYKTSSVSQTLLQYAKNHKVSSKLVDFRLLEYKTMYKYEGDENWQEFTDGEVKQLHDAKFLLQPSLQLSQQYEIEVYKRDTPSRLRSVKIGANTDKSKVVFVIAERTRLKYSTRLEQYIRKNIVKQQLMHGYFIGVFDLKKPLQEFFDVLQTAKAVRYAHRQYIPVAKAVALVPAQDDSLELVYKQKGSDENKDRQDYKKREFSYGVEKGECIICYYYPKEGRGGRDCKGQFLPAAQPKKDNFPDFGFNEDNIEKKENDERIEYFAKRSGYVVFEEGKYDIGQYMEVENIDFKTTGDVALGITGDTRVVVTGKNDMNDSIGQGMHVKAREINVKSGTVGSGAVIEADSVNIQSITHQNSKIYADDISVNVHNGYAKGRSVYVKRLEGGEVEGEKVNIEVAVGGIIKAQEVHVDVLTSNTLIYASKLIEIDTLKGEDNEFMIDPRLVKGLSEDIHALQKDVERFSYTRAALKKELFSKKRAIQASENVIKQIKDTMAANEKKGVKTPATYLQRLQKFQSLMKSIRVDEEELMFLNEELNRLQSQIDVKQSIVLNAQVVNRSRWSGYNKVSFSLISPEIIEETTTEGKKNVIMLKEGGNSRYHIESMELDRADAAGEEADVSRETSASDDATSVEKNQGEKQKS